MILLTESEEGIRTLPEHYVQLIRVYEKIQKNDNNNGI